MTTSPSAGIDAAVLNFDLMPDSAYLPRRILAALLGCSEQTINRRIADGALPPPVGILGLQRYQVSTIREILAGRDLIALDDPAGGFDVPLTDANYREENHV
ncbi:helix-turn-helix domain-containing protein [Burkholderia sp. FERM BP-3421]|uniref:helix-turn-helix transcriptional regulator n=1 Tax=Burkholderia sp. FERM BP-3421 TaxID=1494466 RepID=UPI002362130F|nr:hypothetical protein [Burkholderia sp. FERM BP-3421]WDD94655.1 helix-turn-helix domain-containing protein [Burkholderia sp. FERM BP-3421]